MAGFVYTGPSPAAIHDVAPNGELWAWDIIDYADDFDGHRRIEMGIYIKPVDGPWQQGHGMFGLPQDQPQNFQIPGKPPEWMSFLDVWAKYGPGIVDQFMPSAKAWLEARYGALILGEPLSQQATDARQAIAMRLFQFKPTVSHEDVEPK